MTKDKAEEFFKAVFTALFSVAINTYCVYYLATFWHKMLAHTDGHVGFWPCLLVGVLGNRNFLVTAALLSWLLGIMT